jgi:hypothetical protein
VQSFDVGPAHVVQDAEQGTQAVPSLKLPAGHATPPAVAVTVVHLVASFWSCVKLGPHVMQLPVPSAHSLQPSWQTSLKSVKVICGNAVHTFAVAGRGREKSAGAFGAGGTISCGRPPGIAGARAVGAALAVQTVAGRQWTRDRRG